jgi:hypothetical protein
MRQSAGDSRPAGGARPRSTALTLAAALAVGVALLLAQAAGAAGTRGSQAPSADELWNSYPLQPREAGQHPTPARAADDGNGAIPIAAVAAVAALGLAALAAGVARARRRRREPGRAVAWPGERAGLRPAPPPGRPPDPAGDWTAEVEWPGAGSEVRFRAIARSTHGTQNAVVAESRPFRWPPGGTADVQAMTDAVADVQGLLLSAGWTEIEPGDGWYARRFAWTPAPGAAAATGPEVAARR